MNKANLTLIVPLILLTTVVTTPVAVTEGAFARSEKYTGDVGQAASVRNSYLTQLLLPDVTGFGLEETSNSAI